MKLYHGSNIEVVKPRIRSNLRALDFGPGFYLTSNEDQAIRWAKTVARRRRSEEAKLNIYQLNEEELKHLNVLRFETADAKWLDFVARNRKGYFIEKEYDLIIGPVANDSTLPVIDDYMDGVYTKKEAVKRLLPQNLTDQYAFLTEAALELLSFERSESL